MLALASDTFTRSNSTGLGANWSAIGAKAQLNIASNLAVPPSNAADAADIYTAIAFPNDQYSTIVVGATGAAGANAEGVGPMVRCASGGANTGYKAFCGDATGITTMFKSVAGTLTFLASNPQAWAPGDVATLVAQGTTISLYRNGALLLQVTDAAIAAGSPGIAYSSTVTGSPSIDAWEGGSASRPAGGGSGGAMAGGMQTLSSGM
jgi:hypothetical protein